MKRWAVYLRDDLACVWCGASPMNLSLDHLAPRGHRAHDNDPRRLVTSCIPCNCSWKGMRLAERLAVVRERGRLEEVMERLGRARKTPIDMDAARAWRMAPVELPTVNEHGDPVGLW